MYISDGDGCPCGGSCARDQRPESGGCRDRMGQYGRPRDMHLNETQSGASKSDERSARLAPDRRTSRTSRGSVNTSYRSGRTVVSSIANSAITARGVWDSTSNPSRNSSTVGARKPRGSRSMKPAGWQSRQCFTSWPGHQVPTPPGAAFSRGPCRICGRTHPYSHKPAGALDWARPFGCLVLS
jgi:hypothetical protein